MERIIKSDKEVVVMYHANCPDGFTAAWAAHEKLGDSADYFEFQNGDVLISDLKDKKVFFLDVVPSKEELESVGTHNDIVVIDHHVSNQAKIEGLENIRFDLQKSGAVLSWEYFNPAVSVPELVQYVEDQDLWRWQLPHSQEIFAYISTVEFDFNSWNALALEIRDARDGVVEKGRIILKYRDLLVENTIEKSGALVEFEGHRVMSVNSTTLIDNVAEVLYKKYPPFAIVWFKISNGIKVSLRGDGTIDLSAIAEKYGGGGHKNSCGFIVKSVDQLPWKVINEHE